MNDPSRGWRLKALTDLWTGDANRDGGRTTPTGLLGSLRWWFEVLVRGLGGTACDPSPQGNPCPDREGRRCIVCELFGCTGWGRKFRFDVRDGSGTIMKDQIKRNAEFVLRFTPLRPIGPAEWTLLDLTLRLIADYGAIGGKTVLKPSDEVNRSGLPHHRDYGIVKVEQRPNIQPQSQADLEGYVRNGRWRKPLQKDFAWASLTNFWCVEGKYLARQSANQSTFNKVLGRKEDKAVKGKKGKRVVRWSDLLVASQDPVSQWLAGRQQESKKVFSFKDPPRTCGFVTPELVGPDEIKSRLRTAWPGLHDNEFVTGDAILARLTTHGGATP